MDVKGRGSSSSVVQNCEEDMDLRRGPWTVEEDITLINYISNHGEGRWNSLARCAGLKRTGKSCRLRWLNYLRPDVRRGNITLEEQLMILELHSRWGNRWSKIAQHLPGRTDNEIKNYWRTRVQKHAKQLKCDVDSKQFKDTMRYLWMPRLAERIQAAAATSSSSSSPAPSSVVGCADAAISMTTNYHHPNAVNGEYLNFHEGHHLHLAQMVNHSYTPENSSAIASSESFGAQVSPASDVADCYHVPNFGAGPVADYPKSYFTTSPPAVCFNHDQAALDFENMDHPQQQWLMDCGDATADDLWKDDDVWFLQQQLTNTVL